MKTLFAIAIATVALFNTGVGWAQNGNMMNGGIGWMGGYGGIWTPILLCVVVIGLVVWIANRKGK